MNWDSALTTSPTPVTVRRAALSAPNGREADLQRLHAALDSGSRLLTLHGPGGVGKSTLAEQVLRERAERLPAPHLDIVRLQDAADDAADVAFARALGIREQHQAAHDAVARRLSLQPTLLLIDDADAVRDLSGHLTRWLTACPDLRVVVVARYPLGHPDEVRHEVHGLGDAATYLSDRLRELAPGRSGALDRAELHGVAHALDGRPLDLDLAATALTRFDPAELERRLDDARRGPRLSGWSSGEVSAGLLDAAVDALSPAARLALLRLSLLGGAWRSDDAAAVIGRLPDGADAETSLRELRRHHLLSTGPDPNAPLDPPLTRMSRAVREYARERLRREHSINAVMQRHARHFALSARHHARGLLGAAPDYLSARAFFLRTEPDLRAALLWTAQTGDDADLTELLAGLFWFWQLEGTPPSAFTVLAEATGAAVGRADARYRITIIHAALHLALGQLHEARALLDTTTRPDDAAPQLDAYARLMRDVIACRADSAAELPDALFGAFLGPCATPGPLDIWDGAVLSLARVHLAGGLAAAGCAELARRLADFSVQADALAGRAVFLARSRTLRVQLEHDPSDEDLCGAWQAATAVAHEGLMGRLCLRFAHRARVRGHARAAAVLLARAASWCAAVGAVLNAEEQALYSDLLRDLRSRLDETDLRSAWQDGLRLSVAEVGGLTDARTDAAQREWTVPSLTAQTSMSTPSVSTASLSTAPPITPASAPEAGPLSSRELTVLHLLFEGNQNKQIARAMAISENTVRNHVRSIFQKLDSHTRTEAIATALRLGLVRVRGD